MTEKYPYFIYPDVMALRKGVADEAEAARLRRRIAANVGDIPSLRLMLGMDPEEFARFYPDMANATPSTDDTINSFLEHFGKPDAPVSKATAEIGTDYASGSEPESGSETEGIPVQPSDYQFDPADEAEAAMPADSTASAIDSFLSAMGGTSAPEETVQTPQTPPEPAEKPVQTEADAQMAIKNRDYQTALQIIMRLSLNNPEKSIYFADQIRFLRKLILNQTKQTNRDS